VPRARWLKPEFFRDRKVSNAGPIAALVYQSLWVIADDGGTASCDPDRLKGEMFYGWGAVGVSEIKQALSKLFSLKRIQFYQGSDELFCQILTWDRHQKVHKPSRFRYAEQYADFRETVPDWCGTGEAPNPECPHPRLSDSKTPRLEENQLHGGAPRRTATKETNDTGGPTFSELMSLVRKHLYVPDGRPPGDWEERRDGSILKQLLKRYSGRDVAIAIEGLAVVRDFPGVYADAVTWQRPGNAQNTLGPGAKTTLRALYGSRSGVLPVFSMATQAYWKRMNARPDAEVTQDPEGISDLVRRTMRKAR